MADEVVSYVHPAPPFLAAGSEGPFFGYHRSFPFRPVDDLLLSGLSFEVLIEPFPPFPGGVGRRVNPVDLAAVPHDVALASRSRDRLLFPAALAVDCSIPIGCSKLHPSGFLCRATSTT